MLSLWSEGEIFIDHYFLVLKVKAPIQHLGVLNNDFVGLNRCKIHYSDT